MDRVALETMNKNLIKVFHFVGPETDWLADRYHGEEWYDAEERFYNEFGWNKDIKKSE